MAQSLTVDPEETKYLIFTEKITSIPPNSAVTIWPRVHQLLIHESASYLVEPLAEMCGISTVMFSLLRERWLNPTGTIVFHQLRADPLTDHRSPTQSATSKPVI